jgi:hypothetical protein
MKYSLWHEKVRVGELFDDKPPIKGAIVLKRITKHSDN